MTENKNNTECTYRDNTYKSLLPDGVTTRDPDPFDCFLSKMPSIFESFQIAYISAGIITIIILISIFGRIKLHYRWFILNMAFIDLITCYDAICYSGQDAWKRKCEIQILPDFIYMTRMISKLPYIGIFILTGSRFVSIYFTNFYKRLAKAWKIFRIIFLINTVYVLFQIIPFNLEKLIVAKICFINPDGYIIPNFTIENLTCTNNVSDPDICWDLEQARIAHCKEETHVYFSWIFYLIYFVEVLPFLALTFSIIFVALLISKIGQQFKFQFKTNQEMLKTNIQIVAVFSVQTFMLIFLSILEFFTIIADDHGYPSVLISNDTKRFLIKSLPSWFLTMRNPEVMKCLREIRTFLDSLIVLLFMSGYRDDLIWPIFWCFKKIKMALKWLFKRLRKVNQIGIA